MSTVNANVADTCRTTCVLPSAQDGIVDDLRGAARKTRSAFKQTESLEAKMVKFCTNDIPNRDCTRDSLSALAGILAALQGNLEDNNP